jgi:hypothetical protein
VSKASWRDLDLVFDRLRQGVLCFAMTKLDAAIQRLRALSEEEQEAIAAQIELILDTAEVLTPEQWAEIEARLDADEGFAAHDEVVRAFRDRVG